jgi:short subunit dehydrogenase-like uncharacterized protein
MIAESGICLARDASRDTVGGGFWTTASAMGEPLIGRLQAKAGLTFTQENGRGARARETLIDNEN